MTEGPLKSEGARVGIPPPQISLAHSQVPALSRATVEKGSYSPLDTSQGPTPAYLKEHLVLNGTALISPSSPELTPQEVAQIREFVKASGTRAVVVADTLLTRGMHSLITGLAEDKVHVYFLDHHHESDARATPRQHARAQALRELERNSFITVKYATRDEIPTCSLLVEEGQFKRDKVGVCIGAPFDFDVAGTFFKGAGMRWDTVRGWNKHSLELDCALADSRGPRNHPQLRQEMNFAMAEAQGEFVSTQPHLRFLAKALSVAKLSETTGVPLTQLSEVDVLTKFALAIRDGGGKDSPAWSELGPVGRAENEIYHTLLTLARKNAFLDGAVAHFDLSTSFVSSKQLFGENIDAHKLALALTGDFSSRAPRWMLKTIANDLAKEGALGAETKDGMIMVFSYKSEKGEHALYIVPTGIYRQDRLGNGINFRSLNKPNAPVYFSSLLGETATVYCGPHGTDQSFQREDLARETLEQIAAQVAATPRRERIRGRKAE